MKKTLSIITIAGSLLASQAYAKTEGDYFGVYGMLVKASPKDNSGGPRAVSKDSTRRLRIGFNYQHAFNFNNFFVSPEVFAEALEVQNTPTANGYNDKLELNTRYGAKVNLGYDVNKTFAPYVTVGHGVVEYSSTKSNSEGQIAKKLAASSSGIYGIGANFHMSESVTANIEYNRQNINIAQNLNYGKYKTDITAIKFGMAYHF